MASLSSGDRQKATAPVVGPKDPLPPLLAQRGHFLLVIRRCLSDSREMRQVLTALLLTLAAAPLHAWDGAAGPSAVVPGEIIVCFHDETTAETTKRNLGKPATMGRNLDSLLHEYGAKGLTAVFPDFSATRFPRLRSAGRSTGGSAVNPPDLSGIYVVEVDPTTDLSQAAADVSQDPNVLWAEPNRIYSTASWRSTELSPVRPPTTGEPREATVFNDPFLGSSGSWGQPFNDLWGLSAIGASEAWETSQGGGIIVAVVDTGVDWTHRDLRHQIWRNPLEVRNGIDDDKNTFLDDLRGWDFTRCIALQGDGSCPEPKPRGRRFRDRVGHGTHVAGIIAAAGNNRAGIVGVAPKATIMPVKALSDLGNGTNSDIASAIVYAAINGASVINLSIVGAPSNLMRLAVEFATGLDAVVVAAAGNVAGRIESGVSPANLPEVLAVSATDANNDLASFSNFGGPLALAAPGGGDSEPAGGFDPGSSILSLLARRSSFGIQCHNEYSCDDCAPTRVCSPGPLVVDRRYVRAGGTSMSAAFVSGVAALIRSHHPEFTREQVRQVMLGTAVDLGPVGWDAVFGYGLVSARNAVEISATPVAEIRQPANGAKIHDWQWPLAVVGTVTAPQSQITTWQLILREADSGQVVASQTGSNVVESGLFMSVNQGDVDRGKRYTLELTAIDAEGSTARDTKEFLVPDPQFAAVPFPAPIAGGRPVQLSRDGTRILTTQLTGSETVAWYFDIANNSLFQLSEPDSQSGWMTPDGRLVSFTGVLPDGSLCHDVSTALGSAVVYEVDTGTYRCLPRGVEVQPASAVNASGQRSVFGSSQNLDPDRGNPERRFQLFMFDEEQGKVLQLTDVPEKPFGDTAVVIRRPTIDDSGETIAFEATVPLDPQHPFEPTGIVQAFVYSGRDRSFRQLSGSTPDIPNGICPSISADGRWVAFRSAGGLFLADTSTGGLEQILDGSISIGCPLLSADGASIAFGAIADLDPKVGNEDLNGEVFVFHIANGSFTQVTDTEWSPDCSRGGCFPNVIAVNGDASSLVGVTAYASKNLSLPMLLPTMRLVPIKEGNGDPSLVVPSEITIPTGQASRIKLAASDPEGDTITFAADRVPWSPHARLQDLARYKLEDHGDGTAEIQFSPSADEVGQYTIRVAAFDEHGGGTVKDIGLRISSGTSK